MIARGLLQIILGWIYHTIYRAQCHWTLKREGALIAAVAVMSIGVIDTVRSSHGPGVAPSQQAILSPSNPIVTANATPAVTEQQPLEVAPMTVVETTQTDTMAGPEAVPLSTTAVADPLATDPSALAANDMIGAKILSEKLYTDSLTTGSITPARKPPSSIEKPHAAVSSAILAPERKPVASSNMSAVQEPKPRPLALHQILPPPSAKPAQVLKPAPTTRRRQTAKPSLQQRADNR